MRCQFGNKKLIWVICLSVFFILPKANLAKGRNLCKSATIAYSLPKSVKPNQLESYGISPDLIGDLDALIKDGVKKKFATAISLVLYRRGAIVYQGWAGEAKENSIYDLASLTKIVATTPLIMKLVEDGRISLEAPIKTYLNELSAKPKGNIKIKELLLHISGLHSTVWAGPKPTSPKVNLSDHRKEIYQRIIDSRLRARRGTRFKYSDIGFVLLGKIIEKLYRMPLDQVARQALFDPLGMCATGFAPKRTPQKNIINPWPEGENFGVVYDPIAARMSGVAGHAGLFSSAKDLIRFVNGIWRSKRPWIKRSTLRQFTQAYPLPNGKKRGLGFARGGYALSTQAFGHTGYTGTSLYIDPQRDLAIVLLTNRTKTKAKIGSFRKRVHHVIIEGVLKQRKKILTGLDMLERNQFSRFKGKKLALITNHTAVNHSGEWIVDLFRKADLKLNVLFSPEHGIKSRVDRHLKDSVFKYGTKKIPLYSLFGKRRRPTDETLKKTDIIIFDMQTIGVRYYTYLATLGWAMEEAARRNIPFVVLDRPNPLGGDKVQGMISRNDRRTSTNYYPLALRYGMTIGEIARYFKNARNISVQLEIIKLKGWKRSDNYSFYGKRWINPSPNIRTWRQALLYACLGLLETTNLSVGRGTDSPFNFFGAPWIRAEQLADQLNRLNLKGIYFAPIRIRPKTSVYKGKRIEGVRLILTDSNAFNPVKVAMRLMLMLRANYYQHWKTENLYRLVADPKTVELLLSSKGVPDNRFKRIIESWKNKQMRFAHKRRKALLY